MGEHPIEAAVLGQILHVGEHFLAGRDGVPHQLEGGAGHVRVANDVVLHAQELVFGVTGELDKNRIAVGDDAFGVGLRDDEVVVAHHAFDLGGGDAFLHALLPLGMRELAAWNAGALDKGAANFACDAAR